MILFIQDVYFWFVFSVRIRKTCNTSLWCYDLLGHPFRLWSEYSKTRLVWRRVPTQKRTLVRWTLWLYRYSTFWQPILALERLSKMDSWKFKTEMRFRLVSIITYNKYHIRRYTVYVCVDGCGFTATRWPSGGMYYFGVPKK